VLLQHEEQGTQRNGHPIHPRISE